MKKLVTLLLFMSSLSFGANYLLTWDLPTQRENGDLLDITEIAGYELRQSCGESTVEIIPITGAVSEYKGEASGFCNFEIAVIDTDGLYSDWVLTEYDFTQSPPVMNDVLIEIYIKLVAE